MPCEPYFQCVRAETTIYEFSFKIWPHRSTRRPRVSLKRVYFHYGMTFAAYTLRGPLF